MTPIASAADPLVLARRITCLRIFTPGCAELDSLKPRANNLACCADRERVGLKRLLAPPRQTLRAIVTCSFHDNGSEGREGEQS